MNETTRSWLKKIVDFLSPHVEYGIYLSPTIIAEAVAGYVPGKDYYYNSSWASPKCKLLVKVGILERHSAGLYRLKAGMSPADAYTIIDELGRLQ